MGRPSQRQVKIGKSRKSGPIPFLNFYIFQGGKIKRLSESDARYGYYVDRYSPRSLLAFFTVFLLSILDGQFTLNLISKGVSELNPLMNILIHNNIPAFWFCKIYLTVLSLYLLLIHKNFSFSGIGLGVKHIVLVIIGFYVLIVSGEIILLSQL